MIAAVSTTSPNQITVINTANKSQENYQFSSGVKAIDIEKNKVVLSVRLEKTDRVFIIDTDKRSKTEIKYSSQNQVLRFNNITLATDSKTLYFTSDDFLYKLGL